MNLSPRLVLYMLYHPTSIATDAMVPITQNGSSSLKQPGRHSILSSNLCFKALPTAVHC